MIVGLTGRAGSGKDTVATIMQELYPELNWQIKGFADKLRQVASLLIGIPAEDMKKQEVKEQYLGPEWDTEMLGIRMSLRMFLQVVGTDCMRDNLHKNCWVNALMCDYKPYSFKWKWHEGFYHRTCAQCGKTFTGHKLQRACKECCDAQVERWPNWLITDCRFPNELEAITSRGGICIRIVRPGNPYPKSNHESETALDGVELLTIINDGSLEQLRLRVKEVFDPIVKNIGK